MRACPSKRPFKRAFPKGPSKRPFLRALSEFGASSREYVLLREDVAA